MKFKKGKTLIVEHKEKGVFEALALTDCDDKYYFMRVLQIISKGTQSIQPFEEIYLKADECKLKYSTATLVDLPKETLTMRQMADLIGVCITSVRMIACRAEFNACVRHSENKIKIINPTMFCEMYKKIKKQR